MSGTWVVAGAPGSASAAKPSRPLFHGGFGSIQLAMRLERLSLGGALGTGSPSTSPRAESVLGNRETALTIGAAWHLNRWISIAGNLIHEEIGAAAVAAVPHMRVRSRLIRLQVAI